jgi:ABC-type dipeptide/oligopeptide/nickel transport system permease subunit
VAAGQQASLPPLDVTRAPEGGDVGPVQSGWRLALREFANNRLAVVGVAILLFFVIFCFIGPFFYHANLLQTDLINAHDPPGAGHPLGTDENGFDILGQLMKGGRAAL